MLCPVRHDNHQTENCNCCYCPRLLLESRNCWGPSRYPGRKADSLPYSLPVLVLLLLYSLLEFVRWKSHSLPVLVLLLFRWLLVLFSSYSRKWLVLLPSHCLRMFGLCLSNMLLLVLFLWLVL